MINVRTICSSVILFFALTAPTQASLIIRIDDVGVRPGFSEVIVDVWIHAAPGAGEVLLTGFDFMFQITPLEETIERLHFLNPQDDVQIENERYIFFERSAKEAASVGTVEGDLDEIFRGGDTATPLFSNVTVGTTPLILAQLQLVPSGVEPFLAPQLGDKFEIGLVKENSTFRWTDTSTHFPTLRTIDFEAQSGTVSVIPEPSSVVVWLLGIICMAGYVGWRRRAKVVRC